MSISQETVVKNQISRLPEFKTMQEVCKISIVEDKPIMMDYWVGSINKTVLVGVSKEMIDGKEVVEKILVKSEEEYTSPISKIYTLGTEYLIVTENSIYIVDSKIPIKKLDKS
jgi:hypothetical protein